MNLFAVLFRPAVLSLRYLKEKVRYICIRELSRSKKRNLLAPIMTFYYIFVYIGKIIDDMFQSASFKCSSSGFIG